MPDPWEVPLWPSRGDEDRERTFAGVGGVITVWSMIEAELSHLYAMFTDRPGDLFAVIEFGEEPYFRRRFAKLEEAAERYFTRSPHQNAEGFLLTIKTICELFADRRNEIAHGVVTRVDQLAFMREHLDPEVRDRKNFMVIPMFHLRKYHTDKGTPSFAYNFESMWILRRELFVLVTRINEFHRALSPKDYMASALMGE